MAAGSRAAAPGSAPIDQTLLIWDDAFAPMKRDDREGWLAAMASIDRRLESLGAGHAIDFVLSGRERLRHLRARPSARWLRWQRLTATAVIAE